MICLSQRVETDIASQVGDDIYVLSEGESRKLLARLSVLEVSYDTFRHRINLNIGGPRSAVFFDESSNAVPVNLPSTTNTPPSYEVSCLDAESALAANWCVWFT